MMNKVYLHAMGAHKKYFMRFPHLSISTHAIVLSTRRRRRRRLTSNNPKKEPTERVETRRLGFRLSRSERRETKRVVPLPLARLLVSCPNYAKMLVFLIPTLFLQTRFPVIHLPFWQIPKIQPIDIITPSSH